MRIKISADNFLYLILVVIPFLVMPYTVFVEGGKAKAIYDGIYIVASILFLILMPWGGARFLKRTNILWVLVFVSLVWFLAKLYMVSFVLATDGNFYWVPFLREIKPAIYILFCAFFISRFGSPSVDSFVRAGVFFSVFVLVSFLLTYIVGGGGRPEVIDEANYDNFIVLLAFIASVSKFGLKLDWRFLLFLLATLASQSKTGVVCFIMVIAIFSVGALSVKAVLQFVAGAFVVLFVLYLRSSGIETIEDVDRFRMWLSYIDLINSSGVESFLFGFYPGVPLRYTDPYIGWFITFQSEEALGILGLHPFNYHSMWLRLLCTWGFVPLLLGIIWFSFLFRVSKINFAVASLVLIQGVGMGVFYLSTVAVPMILFMAMANRRSLDNF